MSLNSEETVTLNRVAELMCASTQVRLNSEFQDKQWTRFGYQVKQLGPRITRITFEFKHEPLEDEPPAKKARTISSDESSDSESSDSDISPRWRVRNPDLPAKRIAPKRDPDDPNEAPSMIRINDDDVTNKSQIPRHIDAQVQHAADSILEDGFKYQYITATSKVDYRTRLIMEEIAEKNKDKIVAKFQVGEPHFGHVHVFHAPDVVWKPGPVSGSVSGNNIFHMDPAKPDE